MTASKHWKRVGVPNDPQWECVDCGHRDECLDRPRNPHPCNVREIVRQLRDPKTLYRVTDGHSFNTVARAHLEELMRKAAIALSARPAPPGAKR